VSSFGYEIQPMTMAKYVKEDLNRFKECGLVLDQGTVQREMGKTTSMDFGSIGNSSI
jgi:hypothetical protein